MKKFFIFFFGLILLGLILHIGCSKILQNPPVGIVFRKSMMFSGYVAQVTNLHDKNIMVNLYVKNNKEERSKMWSFSLRENETKEIGVLETNWNFKPGEHGYVEVQGYKTKLYYEIEKGGYFNTNFGL